MIVNQKIIDFFFRFNDVFHIFIFVEVLPALSVEILDRKKIKNILKYIELKIKYEIKTQYKTDKIHKNLKIY